MNSRLSRRELLCTLPFGLAAQIKAPSSSTRKAAPLPTVGEFTRVLDPVTENTIVRLTAISSNSLLPLERNRFVSAKERILLFSSDRSGALAPYQVDLRTGTVKQLAEPAKLNARSLSFDQQEKGVRYLDADSLFEVGLNRGTPKRLSDGCTAFGSAADGGLYLISGGLLIRKQGSGSRTLAVGASDLWPQPNSAGCLFARSTGPDERELYYASADEATKPIMVASGRVNHPCWDVDGESILFLRDVSAPSGAILAEIHGRSVRGGSEYLVSSTTQFACFSPNSNATVFVGASRSRAQPNVVLMLRTPHREMTLCEHHASHPGDVSPVFSPDNRRVYFESDHAGHSAIFSVNVELLVEASG